MNKSFLKFATDIGPLVVFFLFYYNNDKNLKIAIPPLIVATIIAVLIVWILEKKIPMVPLLSGILITLFGGLTIYFDNPIFIYMKPTIINIPPSKGTIGIFFSKIQTTIKAIKVATINGGIATVKFFSFL